MKKGKLFETVIRVVQETLKNSDFTIIKQNHSIVDNAGLKREFDVFIESKLNNFQINVAIECKDYMSKVAVDKIEAFQAKCNDIPRINKKIFVSRVGFQSGAKTKAKFYGIDLLLLEKISETEVLSWLKIGIPKPINIDRILASPGVKFIGESFDFLMSDNLKIENEGIQMPVLNFMKHLLEQSLPKPKIFIHSSDTPMPKLETIRLSFEFPSKAFLIKNEKKYQISHFWFDVEHRYIDLKSEVSFDKFIDLNERDEVTQSVTVISENQDIYSFVKRKGKEEIDIVSKVKIDSKEEIVKIGQMKIEKK